MMAQQMNDEHLLADDEVPDAGSALSALADGELSHGSFECETVIAQFCVGQEARACWQRYHLIGEALRAGPGETPRPADLGFAAAVSARLALEKPWELNQDATVLVAPRGRIQDSGDQINVEKSAKRVTEAANDRVFRWKAVAGLASAAAIAVTAWTVVSSPSPVTGGAQLAQAGSSAAPATVRTLVTAPAGGGVPGTVLRDPQLDQLMAAHRQYGGSPSPAGFLRNATFEVPGR